MPVVPQLPVCPFCFGLHLNAHGAGWLSAGARRDQDPVLSKAMKGESFPSVIFNALNTVMVPASALVNGSELLLGHTTALCPLLPTMAWGAEGL